MATSGRGTGIVGYNVQTAVDTQHHMIVAHEVTNVGHDRTQLATMATAARDAIGHHEMTALADRGYFKGEEILDCEEAGIRTLVPKPLTSGSKADGRFDKRDFIYDSKRDEYRCPAGERAIWRKTTVEKGRSSTGTGHRPARAARSSRNARPATTAASPGGSTSRYWRPCNAAWTVLRKHRDYAGRR